MPHRALSLLQPILPAVLQAVHLNDAHKGARLGVPQFWAGGQLQMPLFCGHHGAQTLQQGPRGMLGHPPGR